MTHTTTLISKSAIYKLVVKKREMLDWRERDARNSAWVALYSCTLETKRSDSIKKWRIVRFKNGPSRETRLRPWYSVRARTKKKKTNKIEAMHAYIIYQI